jgi:protein SCO1
MNHEFTFRRRARGTRVAVALQLLTVSLLSGAIGCGRGAEKPQPAASQPAGSQAARYDLKGKVVSIDRPARRVTVDHEAIPGVMGAMTMAYPVRDPRALDTIATGDEVTAKLVSSDGTYWLEEIAVTNRKS